MTLSELKTQVFNLLSRDQQEEAMYLVVANLKEDSPTRKRFIQLQGRLTKLKQDIILNLISYEEQALHQDRIRAAVIDLLTSISETDLLGAPDSTPAAFSLTELDVLAQQGLKRQAELILLKINRTREALALEDDPGRQIRYETQLEQWETELANLKERAGL